MMKKNYVKPAAKVIKIDVESQLLGDSKPKHQLPEVEDGGDAFQFINNAKPNWFDDFEE